MPLTERRAAHVERITATGRATFPAPEHPDDDDIPHWVVFASDKSKSFDRVMPVLDRLLDAYGIKFWLTSEYDIAAEDWDEHEIRAGLNRTYRLIQ
jgi:hypothetical protein